MGDLTLVHHDETIVVVDKPGGLLSVPGRGPDRQDCVVNRVRAAVPGCIRHPSVHRLDMDTSGLLVLALTTTAQRDLRIQFERREVAKTYVARLDGVLERAQGEITLAFRLDPGNRPRQVHDPERGKVGITRWRRLELGSDTTLVELTPLTGRTHQLRVHAAHPLGLGLPIVGDRLYGTGTAPGQLQLHASALAFRHPASGERLTFRSRPPFIDARC